MTARARVTRVVSRTAAAVALLMMYGVSANALAASQSVVKCKELNGSNQDLAVAVSTLSINVVEHIPADPGDKMDEPLDRVDVGLQQVAPVLSLSPRVAAILDRVFSANEAQDEPAESDSGELSSPVAGEQADKSLENESPDLAVGDKNQLPKKKLRMYRRDI